MIKVVVGVPLYNEEKYVEQTLMSLKAQDYNDAIFIISDNSSSDSTWEICQSITKDDSRFQLQRNSENIGSLENAKKILFNSDSQYFMWLGGHDYISPGFISQAVKQLDNNAGVSIVAGLPYAVCDGKDNELLEEAIYKFTHKKVGRYLQSVRELRNCTIVNSLFRRSAIEGFEFRLTRGPDMVFLSHLLWHGQLEYMSNEFYYRRYFESRNSTYEERVVGSHCLLSYHDLILYYLDDFGSIFNGDERMKRYVENEIISILVKKHGVQCLVFNDEI
jgi:glycosyltransferase involved in cell wall biosynthesis